MLLFSSVSWSEPLQLSHSTGAAIDPRSRSCREAISRPCGATRDRAGRSSTTARASGVSGREERQLLTMPGNCRTSRPRRRSPRRIVARVPVRGRRHACRSSSCASPTSRRSANPSASSASRSAPENAERAHRPGRQLSGSCGGTARRRSSLWFARFRTDSGLTAPQALTSFTIQSQTAYSAALDSVGGLHLVWQVSGPGVNELRYQHRYGSAAPDPVDCCRSSRAAIPCRRAEDRHRPRPEPAPRLRIQPVRSAPRCATAGCARTVNGTRAHECVVRRYGLGGEPDRPADARRQRDRRVRGRGSPLRFLVAPPRAGSRRQTVRASASRRGAPGLVLGPNPLRAGRRASSCGSRRTTPAPFRRSSSSISPDGASRARVSPPTAAAGTAESRARPRATGRAGSTSVRAAGTNHAARLVVVH